MIEEKLSEDLLLRRRIVQKAICESNSEGLLLTSDVNIYYLTGFVFNGYYYLPAEGEPVLFVKRPLGVLGERVFYIRKPEQIPEIFSSEGWQIPGNVLLETDEISYNECLRLQKAFDFKNIANATTLMRRLRMVKTPWEIEQIRLSAKRHVATYSEIQECFRPGMTDLLLQAEIEHKMRLNGSVGMFRTFGANMNIFMGSLLAGENAENTSPYDFALGGGGQTSSVPIGANGTLLEDGMAVMIDMAGNYTDYLTDMTRVFSIGQLPEHAYKAHQVALEIQVAVETRARPGVLCSELYELSISLVNKAGLSEYFMGTKQQAMFVGHGIGLQINEPPVLTTRSKEVLEEHMVFAFEPKFVIPKVGAVGIENSFLVTKTGVEKLTIFEENIIPLINSSQKKGEY